MILWSHQDPLEKRHMTDKQGSPYALEEKVGMQILICLTCHLGEGNI